MTQALHIFRQRAMAAPWTIRIRHDDKRYAAQAAQAAFDSLARLETDLSHFQPDSEISQINALPADKRLVVSEDCFRCLQVAGEAWKITGGAFDVSIGRLFRCWITPEGKSRIPNEAELQEARALTGFQLLELHPDRMEISKQKAGLQLDLGGIGKGYALDAMAKVLGEWEVESAQLDAASSVLGTGPTHWEVTCGGQNVRLKNRAVSASGRTVKGEHIIDPHSGQPIQDRLRAWAFTRRTALADALSTAFMIMPREKIKTCLAKHKNLEAWWLVDSDDGEQVVKL